jgi:hypothetical protein
MALWFIAPLDVLKHTVVKDKLRTVTLRQRPWRTELKGDRTPLYVRARPPMLYGP